MSAPQQPQAAVPFSSVAEVRREVGLVAKAVAAGDLISATLLERGIWDGVLEAIAGSNAQAGYLAAAALETKQLDFQRVLL